MAIEGARTARRRCRRRVTAGALALCLAAFAGVTARLFVWPDVESAPGRVDAIIELAGPGDRDPTTLALADEHEAPFMAQSTTAEEEGAHDCLPSMPGVTVLCFHPDPETTRGEARRVGRLAVRYHWKSIILVTTRDHAWRAKLRFSRCFGGQIYVETAPLPPLDWFWAIPYQWAATIKAFTTERGC